MNNITSPDPQNNFLVPWKKSLKFRLTILIALFSLFTGVIMMFFLAHVYQIRIERDYKNRVVTVARTTASYMDAAVIDRYLRTLERDDEYEQMLEYLRVKQRETGVLFISVSRIFEDGEIFIFDTDEDEGSRMALGERTTFIYEEGAPGQINQVLSGEDVEPYSQRTRWGWLLTALEPIFREDGSLAAHAAASISMDELLKERRNEFFILGLIITLVLFISIMINLHIIKKFVISPITKLSGSVTAYLPGATKLEYSEKPITPVMHHGDELELLERVIIEMESRVNLSMEAERMASSVKNAFLANMSHELRTPLNSTINMIREALSSEDHKKNTDALQQAAASSNDLLAVLNTILEISNIESGKLLLSNSAFLIDSVVSDINNLISSLCKARGILWDPQIKIRDSFPVEGDRIRLMQALTILLRNAVKYASEQQGKVSFVIDLLEETDNRAHLYFEVSDNGIGMSDRKMDELNGMFAPDNNQIHYSSSEIMLSACNSIVKAMGAQIKIMSDPDKGSSFSFSLIFPKAPMPVQPEEVDLDNLDFSGKRVLIADDVEVNRTVLKFILEHTGLDIIEARDGKEAVDKFLAEPEKIDLILMDIMMPNMDGYEASREIRASGLPRAGAVPIIAVTSLSYKEDVDTALEAGMNYHLEKPVEPEKLLLTLMRFLQ